MKRIITHSIFGLLIFSSFCLSKDFEVTPVWHFQNAFISIVNQDINLYRSFGNTAWLNNNDSTNWMIISSNSNSKWGNLKRFWDPYGKYYNNITFAGQKHLSQKQTFFGAITYHMDYLSQLNQAIEIEPYALDPFVISDSTAGDFSFAGPTVKINFCQQFLKNLWFGIGLDYTIYRGLKKVYSMPEIIRRNITLNANIAYQFNPHFVFGFSYRPYDYRDITKIVKQPDGSDPLILRYRGEHLFIPVITTTQRFSIYTGYELSPQFLINFDRIQGGISLGYYYRWTEIYDNPTRRLFDGFYQAKHYFVHTLWNFNLYNNFLKQINFAYKFRYISDWAQEPIKRLAIYRSFNRRHQVEVGTVFKPASSSMLFKPILKVQYWLPERNDYLAKSFRKGAIINWKTILLMEKELTSFMFLYGSVAFNKYAEHDIWNYFQKYNGWTTNFGFSYHYGQYIFQFYMASGEIHSLVNSTKQQGFNLGFQIRQFF